MSTIILTILFSLTFILLSYFVFKKWFNHIATYLGSWALCIVLYEMKLIRFVSINDLTWYVIVVTTLLYILGWLVVVSARFSAGKPVVGSEITKVNTKDLHLLFADDAKKIRYFIIICTLFGVFIAVQRWWVLIDKFGSIEAVLLKAHRVYRVRIAGGDTGSLPFVIIVPYVGIVLSGLYTAYRGKFSLYSVAPFITVVIAELASFGRSGILLGVLQLVISFLLCRNLLQKESNRPLPRKGIIITLIVVLLFGVLSFAIVKQFRGTVEDFKSTGIGLRQFKNNPIISPSVYLYASSNVGVLSKYFERLDENVMFGENTLLPIYSLLSKFDLMNHPPVYPHGYFIPMWSNAATYLKDFHTDFGNVGVLFLPFFIGFMATFYWYYYQEKGKLSSLVVLIYLNIIICHSILYMITRSVIYFSSFLILVYLLPAIAKSNAKREALLAAKGVKV